MIGQGLQLSTRGEQLSIQELITEPEIEGLSKAVLPGGSWLNVGGTDAAASGQSLRIGGLTP